jgi:hypothetical protein
MPASSISMLTREGEKKIDSRRRIGGNILPCYLRLHKA